MATDTPQRKFYRLPDQFVATAVPSPEEPFEYPSVLALDDGVVKGEGGAGAGESKVETSYEKCRKFLVDSDKARAEEWKDGIGTQLLVSSLLSAVTTSFIIESQKNLTENPAETSVILLAQLIKQMNQSAELPNIGSKPFVSPSPRDEAINALWFTSLALSLAVVTIGLLCLQWIQEFNKHGDHFDDMEYFTLRAAREHGFRHWKAHAIISTLPLLLITSLVTFFIGLLLFLSNLTPKIIVPVYIILLTTCALVIFTTFGPAFIAQRQSSERPSKSIPMPFRSLQSWFVMRITLSFTRVFSEDWIAVVFDSPDWLSLDKLWMTWSSPPFYPISSSLSNIPGSANKVAAIHCLDRLGQEAAKRGDWNNSLRLQRRAYQLATKFALPIPVEHLLERLIRICDTAKDYSYHRISETFSHMPNFTLELQEVLSRDSPSKRGLLVQLVNTITSRWNLDNMAAGALYSFMILLHAISELLCDVHTTSNDLPHLLLPLFAFVRSVESHGYWSLRLPGSIWLAIFLLRLSEGDRCRARQTVYVMSRHSGWSIFHQLVNSEMPRCKDDDGQEVDLLNLSWMQPVLDPDFVPPSEWNLDLPAEWDLDPLYQGQEHESGRCAQTSGAHGDVDEGSVVGHEEGHPMTTISADAVPITSVPDKTTISDPPLSTHETPPVPPPPTIVPDITLTMRTSAEGLGPLDVESGREPGRFGGTDHRSAEGLGVIDPLDDRPRQLGGPGAEKNV